MATPSVDSLLADPDGRRFLSGWLEDVDRADKDERWRAHFMSWPPQIWCSRGKFTPSREWREELRGKLAATET